MRSRSPPAPNQRKGAPPCILVVDDDTARRAITVGILAERGHDVTATGDAADAAAFLKQERFDLLITDLAPGSDGIGLIRTARDGHPDTAVIALPTHPAFEGARLAFLENLQEPLDPDQLQKTAWTDATAQDRSIVKSHASQGRDGRGARSRLIAESAPMLEVFRMIETIGSTDAPVLLQGETGSGKELVARGIHWASPRSSGPFVPVNCGALSKALVESLLFGHTRGSFTGAETDHAGYFAQAHGGTILLDEIGDLPIELQPVLLRVLDDKIVCPVGSEHGEPVDFRVIAATNRNLSEAVDANAFRRDLYTRICLVRIDIPPLRDRGKDVLLLMDHFLATYARRYNRPCRGLTAVARAALLRYDWPGNVRDVQHLAANLILTCEHDPIDDSDLPDEFHDHGTVKASSYQTLPLTLDLNLEEATHAVRCAHAQRVLASVGGNHRKAAAKLGVATRTLRRILGKDEQK